MRRTTQAAIAALALLLQALPAHAQDRSRSGRARLELSFDHGAGGSTEGPYGELAADLRLHTPEGFGAVLRTGIASNLLSYAFAIDLGVAQRFDLVAFDHVGLQLSVAGGPSIGEGPFDRGRVGAFGGWGMLHADLWYRNFFVSERDVLVFQGVLDTYIPPPIANPFALSLGLDLAGAALDGPFTSRPLTRDMALVGGRHLPAGLRANQGARTRVTVQLAEDGLEDGHEVMFQRPDARAMLTRFLRDMSARSPR